jgi:tripartite-type tricarboxylate transporter receptor subunit TctC
MTLIRTMLVGLLALTVVSPGAAETTFPAKPVRIVVGYPPGAGTDLPARVFADYFSNVWKQTVIVDNKPGASGSIGAAFVARAPADGYTLLLAGSSHLIQAAMTPDLQFRAVDDFTPISLVGTGPLILEVNKSLKANSVKELIDLAKSQPNGLTYASAGTGTSPHIAGEMFDRAMGMSMRHVPYKGSAPAQVDLIGGQINLMFQVPQAAIPTILSKDVRALAVTGNKRLPDLPDVPTFKEAGYSNFDLVIWLGIMGPRGMPKDVTDKINGDIKNAIADESVRKRLHDLGLDPVSSSSADFLKQMNTDFDSFKKTLKEAGIRNE